MVESYRHEALGAAGQGRSLEISLFKSVQY